MHAPDRDTKTTPSRAGWLLLPLLLMFAYALARTAWLSDDAYISFRSVEHLLAGRGPVWNAGERVQAFTHPLWFFMVAAARATTGEFYYAVLALSMALSLAAVGLAVFSAHAPWPRRALVLLLCCSSRAFVDYGTSGLENPLSHLLLAGFVALYLGPGGRGRYFRLVLLSALAMLTRQDALLIYAPALALEGFGLLLPGARGSGVLPQAGLPVRCLGLLGATVAGLSVYLVWEAFSVIYYGFPVPNTAFAKLSTGVPRADLLVQGFHYLTHAIEHDPLTLVAIVAGLIVGAAEREGRFRALAAGIALYLLYTVWIGGDFMAGRFFALPFWGAMLLLMNATLGQFNPPLRVAGGLVLLLALAVSTLWVSPKAPLLSGPRYPDLPMYGRVPWDWRGIADERGGYYPWTGLLRADRDLRAPELQPWARMGRQLYEEGTPVMVQPAVGHLGWQAAERTFIVDQNALTDPLLARLPAIQEPKWRVGHFRRALPPGYLATLVLGENRIADPEIAAFYDDLRLVTRGPIWTVARLRAIVRLNLDRTPGIVDPEYFRAPPGGGLVARRHYPAAWFDATDEPRVMPGTDSFALYWSEPEIAPVLEIVPPPATEYDVEIALGGQELGRFLMSALPPGDRSVTEGGSPSAMRKLPPELANKRYDTLRLFPRGSAETQIFATIRRQPSGEPAVGATEAIKEIQP